MKGSYGGTAPSRSRLGLGLRVSEPLYGCTLSGASQPAEGSPKENARAGHVSGPVATPWR
jgi:hypothetical protein